MTAKCLLPNQCTPLHLLYGRGDCCLCNAREEIQQLRGEIEALKTAVSVSNTSQDVNLTDPLL